MTHTIAIGALIRPPSYSGQTDSGTFLVLQHLERGQTIAGVWDERNTFSATVATDPYAGLFCLRLHPAVDYKPVPYHSNAQSHDLCIWRVHPNVQFVQVGTADAYLKAQALVRMHDYAEMLRCAKQAALNVVEHNTELLNMFPEELR